MHGTEPPESAILERLLHAAPFWANCTREGRTTMAVAAAVPRAGGTMSRPYYLAVTTDSSSIVVKEAVHARLLPRHCPDRHINGDGSFCLGLRAEYAVVDVRTAAEWWAKLRVFLTCQETAHETRTWPTYAQMSHGAAAEIQVEAETLAAEMGMTSVYKAAIEADEGIVAAMVDRVRPDTMRLLNGRAACVCGRTGDKGIPLLRRQCRKSQLKCLPILEWRRRQAVEQFWKLLAGTRCCGTMDNCRLAERK